VVSRTISFTKMVAIGRPKFYLWLQTSEFFFLHVTLRAWQPGDTDSNLGKCKKFCCSEQCPYRLWAPSRLRRGTVGGTFWKRQLNLGFHERGGETMSWFWRLAADLSPRRSGFDFMQVRLWISVEKGQFSIGAIRLAPGTVSTPVPHSHSFTYHRHYITLVFDWLIN
jgi:hypothetical protein